MSGQNSLNTTKSKFGITFKTVDVLSKNTFRCINTKNENETKIISKINNPVLPKIKEGLTETSNNTATASKGAKPGPVLQKGSSNKNIKKLNVQAPAEDNPIETARAEEFKLTEKLLSETLNNTYLLKLDKFIKRDDYSLFIYDSLRYTMKDLLSKNQQGVDIQIIKSIIYQLLRAIKFLKRKCVTFFNIKPENIMFNLERHQSTLIGFENKLEFLMSNAYNINHDIYLRVKLSDFTKVKKNDFVKKEPIIEVDPKKKKAKEDLKKTKPPAKDNKKDKSKDVTSNFIVEELLADTLYEFNAYYPPELYVKYLFRNYISQDEDNPEPPAGNEIDIWGIGCILAELIDGNKLFPLATNDFECICIISKLVGLTQDQLQLFNDNNISLEAPGLAQVYINDLNQTKVDLNISIAKRYLGKAPKSCIDLLTKMLNPDPKKRITVEEALKHPFVYPYFEINAIQGNFIKGVELAPEPIKMIDSQFKKLSEFDKAMKILNNIVLTKEEFKVAN